MDPFQAVRQQKEQSYPPLNYGHFQPIESADRSFLSVPELYLEIYSPLDF